MQRAVLLAAGLLAAAPCASATPTDTVQAMRALRQRGCDSHGGVTAPLRVNAALNAAASHWSRGGTLQAAIAHSGYREDQSAGLHVSGTSQALEAALSQRLCASLTDARLTDAGVLQRGSDTWIVLAAPFTAPRAAEAGSIALEVLQLVNAARAHAQRCGRSALPAAPPLRLNELLSRAAQSHVDDMLQFDYFEHQGRDGSTPAQRVAATGYRYRLVGENLALGPESSQEVVSGWLASPAHCQNLMDSRFGEMGVAFAANRSGEPRIYWAQELATAR